MKIEPIENNGGKDKDNNNIMTSLIINEYES